ncbi:hypothetical protein [Caproiciproducens faecalis]|nr:hypothetical protein [Caproiciproducens faecalis]
MTILKRAGDEMVKYKRSLKAYLLLWIAFFMLLGASIFVAQKWAY